MRFPAHLPGFFLGFVFFFAFFPTFISSCGFGFTRTRAPINRLVLSSSLVMSQPAGKCAFCGEPGALTKSHIWPDWAGNVVPFSSTSYISEVGVTNTFETNLKTPNRESKKKNGSAAKRKPRNTCYPCNGGWMEPMETAARPAITKLMLGEAQLLDPFNQRLVAAFLCLASMRLERGGKTGRAIPNSDIVHLKTKREPPPTWHIWITHFSGITNGYFSAHTAMQRGKLSSGLPTGPEYCNEQVSTFIAGKLCAHLFSSTIRGFGGYEGIAQTRIWPPSGLDIDSRFIPSITWTEVNDLHEAIARDGNPPVRV